MKFATSNYSFWQEYRSGKMTYMEIFAKTKEMGFDAIELIDLIVPEGKTEEEFAYEVKAECDRLELPICNYTISADLLNKEIGPEVERIKKKIDIAAILGVEGVRHDAGNIYSQDNPRNQRGLYNEIDRIADACREITEYAATKGIKTMVENHGQLLQSGESLELLVNKVNHPNFGVLCDFGNFVAVDDDNVMATSTVAPYTFFAHAKDVLIRDGNCVNPGKGWHRTKGGNYVRGTIFGHGDINAYHCLKNLYKVGYRGYVSIEYEGLEDCLYGIQAGLDNLRQYKKILEQEFEEIPW